MSANNLPKITVPEFLINRKIDDSKFITRENFDRDRDRILYSRPFRRLSGKTQVFLTASHDYIRTRMTHTLEVAQLSRDIASALKLDVSLVEAIALGHDLGHTPFGHVGERTLNELMNGCHQIAPCQDEMKLSDMGFKHNLQSCRVAQILSRLYRGEHGLNLTNFTLWGMANHSHRSWGLCKHIENRCRHSNRCRLKPFANPCSCQGNTSVGYYDQVMKEYATIKDSEDPAWSFEAFIVCFADEIAQRHHDIEDALVTKITSPTEIARTLKEYFDPLLVGEDYEEDKFYLKETLDFAEKDHRACQESAFIPYVSRFVLNLLKKRLIQNSAQQLAQLYKEHHVVNADTNSAQDTFDKVYFTIPKQQYEQAIGYDPEFLSCDEKLQDFLKNRVLNSFHAQRMDGVGTYIIRNLAEAYMSNPQQLPDKMIGLLMINLEDDISLEPRDPEVFGDYRNIVQKLHNRSDNSEFQIKLLRTICDHISGMTDRYAFAEYQQLYGSSPLRTFDVV
ncbi:MAG: dGTP triphosphohydrolase [Armatimonadota bacterium]|nr:dNTP triphosphohydrolase [bacterium]